MFLPFRGQYKFCTPLEKKERVVCFKPVVCFFLLCKEGEKAPQKTVTRKVP